MKRRIKREAQELALKHTCALIRMHSSDTDYAGEALRTCTGAKFGMTYLLDSSRREQDYMQTQPMKDFALAKCQVARKSIWRDDLADVYRTMVPYNSFVDIPPYARVHADTLREFVAHCEDQGALYEGKEPTDRIHRFALAPMYEFHSAFCALLFLMWHVFLWVANAGPLDWFGWLGSGRSYRGTYVVCTLVQRMSTGARGNPQTTVIIPAERRWNTDKAPFSYGGINVEYVQPEHTGSARHFMNMVARETLGFRRLVLLLLYWWLVSVEWWAFLGVGGFLGSNVRAIALELVQRPGKIVFWIFYLATMTYYGSKYFRVQGNAVRALYLIPLAPLISTVFLVMVLYAKTLWSHGHPSVERAAPLTSFKMPTFDPLGYARGRKPVHSDGDDDGDHEEEEEEEQ